MSTIIDINVTPTIEEVTINTTEFITTINVNTNSGGGGVQSVTGTAVDNTDPLNPIINNQDLTDYTLNGGYTGTAQDLADAIDNVPTPTLQEVTNVGNITTNDIKVSKVGVYNPAVDNFTDIRVEDTTIFFQNLDDNSHFSMS